MLGKNIDWKAIQNEFASKGYVRINNVLEETVCERVRDQLVNEAPWGIKFTSKNGPITLPRDEFLSMSPQQLKSFHQELIWATQNKGMAYFYFTCELDQLGSSCAEFIDYIMSQEFVGLIKYVTGNLNINGFEGHSACYRPNCFLTTHHDLDAANQRKTAFIFGFTKFWKMEWGGLLHMLDDDMNINEVLVPSHNTLTLFSVPRNHFVSHVAPYASQNPKHGRYTITGWYLQK